MYPLDEIRPEKTLKMTNDAKMYCRRNRDRLNKTVDILMENPTLYQKAKRRMAYQQLEKSPARTSPVDRQGELENLSCNCMLILLLRRKVLRATR